MGFDIVTCPTCQAEHSPGIPFCQNCGDLLDASARDSSFEENSSDFALLQGSPTEDLLRLIVNKSGFEHSSTNAGWKVTVPINGNRKQIVHVFFNGKEKSGRDLISFLSVCGKYTSQAAESLLKQNSRLISCSHAIRKIKKQDYIVVTANQLSITADQLEVESALLEVAKTADNTEKWLSKGKDVY